MQRFVRLARALGVVPVLAASSALFMLMVMTFCDVILRSAFSAPIGAATELTRILVAIVVFAVMPAVCSGGRHIAVDLSDRLVAALRLRRLRDGFIYLIPGVLMMWPVMRVWTLAERSREYGDITEVLRLPQFLVGWFIAAFATLSAVAMIVTGLIRLLAPHILAAEPSR